MGLPSNLNLSILKRELKQSKKAFKSEKDPLKKMELEVKIKALEGQIAFEENQAKNPLGKPNI